MLTRSLLLCSACLSACSTRDVSHVALHSLLHAVPTALGMGDRRQR